MFMFFYNRFFFFQQMIYNIMSKRIYIFDNKIRYFSGK
ncbi:hypothetical protein R1080702_111 [Cyanophage S-RIM32]|uniref:Uncharacterized protein n=1 Tax=Cyanophage S-RIM32 TaxID=1278479 RepID=A0A127KMB8_9CAUD|nr:hypothetical protein BJD26_gp145 [Cyanophage S-RIM32]AMO43120.1 hypothetical protein R1080702_111 [Cyanophage S-RIM32]